MDLGDHAEESDLRGAVGVVEPVSGTQCGMHLGLVRSGGGWGMQGSVEQ